MVERMKRMKFYSGRGDAVLKRVVQTIEEAKRLGVRPKQVVLPANAFFDLMNHKDAVLATSSGVWQRTDTTIGDILLLIDNDNEYGQGYVEWE